MFKSAEAKRAWQREWRLRNLEHAREIERASKRRQRLDPDAAERMRAADAEYRASHREAVLERKRLWHARNRDRILAAKKTNWQNKDARQRFAYHANRKAGSYGSTEMLDWETLPPGPWTCTYCGIPCESWDHVEQLVLGGPNNASNLVPSCLPCNLARPHKQRRYVHAA